MPHGSPLTPPASHTPGHFFTTDNAVHRFGSDSIPYPRVVIEPFGTIRTTAIHHKHQHPQDMPGNPDVAVQTNEGLSLFEGQSDGFFPHMISN
jgi:hypothetical protein